MKFTLSRKLYGGFGIVLVILAILLTAALLSTDRLVASKTASQYSYETIQRAAALENQLANISIGIRGYMLTGKEDMLGAVYAGDGEVEKSLKTLRAQLGERPEQLARLAPVPDWSAAAASLAHALGDWWRQDRPERPVRLLIESEDGVFDHWLQS